MPLRRSMPNITRVNIPIITMPAFEVGDEMSGTGGGVGDGVAVSVGVGVNVGVFVAVRVAVCVGVSVGVGVRVGVFVAVRVAVSVGVFVGVLVGVGVGGSTSTPAPTKANATWLLGLECEVPVPKRRPFAAITPGETLIMQVTAPLTCPGFEQAVEAPAPIRLLLAQVNTVQPAPATHGSLISLQPVTGCPFAPGQQNRAPIAVISQGNGATPRLTPKLSNSTGLPFGTVVTPPSGITCPPNEVVHPGGDTSR